MGNRIYNPHPPACTCVDCTQKRLRKFKRRSPKFQVIFWLLPLVMVFAAFVGAEPLSTYKDAAFSSISKWWESPTKFDRLKETITSIPIWNTKTSDYASRFNQYRQSNGLPALTFTDDLNMIAALRLWEIKTNFSHESKGNYSRGLGENIIKGVYNNQDALLAWEGSPGHNANMLDGSYKFTGYACDGYYAVQVFTEEPIILDKSKLPQSGYFKE